jgi:RHS repeat-associated protein
MGYFLTTSPDPSLARPLASPKTHTPLSRVEERGRRYYSPEVGRWLSRDPLGENGGIGLYRFVRNDAVNWRDWLGLSVICPPGSADKNCTGNSPPCYVAPTPSTCSKSEVGTKRGVGQIYIRRCKYWDKDCKQQDGTQACRDYEQCFEVVLCGPADPGGEKPSTGYYWWPIEPRCGPCSSP